MADDKTLTKHALVIAFAAAVAALGANEIYQGASARAGVVEFKDPKLVEHLYGVSVLERGRYTQKSLEDLRAERQSAEGRMPQPEKARWRVFIEQFWP